MAVDPRTTWMIPVDEPLFGEDAATVRQALRAPVDEPLFGTVARIVGEALRDN